MVCCFTDNFMRIFFFCTVVPNGKNLVNFIFCTVVPICRKMAKMFFFTTFKQNLSVYTDYPPYAPRYIVNTNFFLCEYCVTQFLK